MNPNEASLPWREYMDREIQTKALSNIQFRQVINGCLQGVKLVLDETGRPYFLRAYVRRTDDGWEENVVHLQMQFNSIEERDAVWNRAGDVVARCVRSGLKETAIDAERREIENILCAVRST